MYINADYQDVEWMLAQLTEDELEEAARSSFEYINQGDEEGCCNDDKQSDDADAVRVRRARYAGDMARRYLQSKKDKEKALCKMKATLQFRKTMDIGGLIQAATDAESESHVGLTKFLSDKKAYVQGYDKAGRSTFLFLPRNVRGHDPDWTVRGHMYTLERAIACSKAPDKTVNCVVDFNGFSLSKHAPPTSIGVDLMTTLRDHYVGYVHRIFLVDAPQSFLWLWSFFKHFAGTTTRDKIQFINSRQEKTLLMDDFYGVNQATSWMLPGGKKNRELDLEEYLQGVPFDVAYDDETRID